MAGMRRLAARLELELAYLREDLRTIIGWRRGR